MPGRQRVSTDGTEVVKFNFITYRRYRRQITGLIGKPRTFSSNPTLLLSPRVPEPILQPLRWDAQPVGQAQKVNQERRPQTVTGVFSTLNFQARLMRRTSSTSSNRGQSGAPPMA